MATKAELAEALEAARRAAEAKPADTFIERLVERIGAKASVSAVFGKPIERDDLTIIPVARVRWGFGGGAGEIPVGPVDQEAASGGGGAVTADPVGWIEIGADGVEFVSIVPAMPSPAFVLAAGATAALVLRGLARLLRG